MMNIPSVVKSICGDVEVAQDPLDNGHEGCVVAGGYCIARVAVGDDDADDDGDDDL